MAVGAFTGIRATASSPESVDQCRLRGQGGFGAVELLDRDPAALGLGQQRRTLEREPPLLAPFLRNAQVADALDARVVRAEHGGHRATFTAESPPPCRSVPAG
jgi:hypothetical protein